MEKEIEKRTIIAETKPRDRWLILVGTTLSCLICFCIGFAIAYFALPCKGKYSGNWELRTPTGLRKTVLNSEVVLFLRSISVY